MSYNAVSLFVAYLIFLNFGALIFMHLEWESVEKLTIHKLTKWERLTELISNSGPPENEDELTSLVGWLFKKCPHLSPDYSLMITSVGNQSQIIQEIADECEGLESEIVEKYVLYPWSFLDSLYFSMTVCTTIGYGHISPSTSWGRVVCMLYAVVGIPLTMMFLTWTSDFFGELLFNLFKAKIDTEKQSSKIFIALGTGFYITIGFIVFIFLPAIVFMYTEDWTYLEGVYYAFITLTTIGFGDFVTGKSMEGEWEYIYQILVILWILGGLGYWVMIANFITRALNSKKMISFAKKATDIKKLMTQVGITKDDPEFVTQYSKTTLNFMLQLSNALVMPELAQSGGNIPMGRHNSISQGKPLIPGIASLFGQSGLGGMMATMVPKTDSTSISTSRMDIKCEDENILTIEEDEEIKNVSEKGVSLENENSDHSSITKENDYSPKSSPLINTESHHDIKKVECMTNRENIPLICLNDLSGNAVNELDSVLDAGDENMPKMNGKNQFTCITLSS